MDIKLYINLEFEWKIDQYTWKCVENYEIGHDLFDSCFRNYFVLKNKKNKKNGGSTFNSLVFFFSRKI